MPARALHVSFCVVKSAQEVKKGPRQMDTSPFSITHPLALELIDATGAATSVIADLTYDAEDPYAVAASFSLNPRTGRSDEIIRWVFARELLDRGVHEPAGDGDVHIWPCLNEFGQAITVIELSSPDGEAVLQARTDEMCGFLRETALIVPAGSETTFLDVDDAIAKLLA
jgi:Streptomyces sporulation and cell division protein, SsgA